MTERSGELLIIGAGPYGMAMAAEAYHDRIDYLIVGDPMSFWRDHMPAGMFLRSVCDWHLDPHNVATIDAYLTTIDRSPEDVEPLSLDFYLGYAAWFRQQNQIAPVVERVIGLDQTSAGTFVATLEEGAPIAARKVMIALGFGAFPSIPLELSNILPAGSYGHTCDEVDLRSLAGKRVLVIGGRQSAYEWAALLGEAGASHVHLVHRHPTPAFAQSDWSWVGPLVDTMIDVPGWYRHLPDDEKTAIVERLYIEGRLKLEPWLQPRVDRPDISIWADNRIATCMRLTNDELAVTFETGDVVEVDHIILATGYNVEIDRLPLLARGNIISRLETRNGFPVLDERFQTNIPGLYITSLPATQDFGPFFAFTIAARASARVIGSALLST